ncbi:hypothetical protein [Burkholderia phage FLC9]|nr:hypothetical protein [Burkholderia phage FLC9]
MLVQRVLKGISDTRAVSDHKPGRLPLDDLVDEYNEKSARVAELPTIEPTSTGKELKDAIDMMDPEDQVWLLYRYLQRCDDLPKDRETAKEVKELKEEESEIETRDLQRLKIWLIKGSFIIAAAVVLIVVGATAMVAWREGHATDNPAMSVLWHTAKEILSVLVGGGE